MELILRILLVLSVGLQVKSRTAPLVPIELPPVELPRPPPKPASYIAIVPQYVRPNTDLNIPVTFLQPVTSQTVTALLLKGNETLATDTVESAGQQEVTLTLKVPDVISWGSYRLNISGSGSIEFKNSTYVWGKHKSMSIFVQTDKAKYKPGDAVKYRMFAVDGALNPLDVLLDVSFYDPKGNKIDEINKEPTGKEGIDGRLELSDMPPLGNWRIEVVPVDRDSARTNYYFDVEEYVLPKFEVTVRLPSFGDENEQFLTGTVSARYTFGKPVQGFLRLTITKPWGRGFYDPRAIRTEKAIDGDTTFNIDRVVLERMTRHFQYKTLVVKANVTEAVTGITQEGSANIQYHSNPYKVEFHPNMADNFKPGFNPYPVLAKVSRQDNSPPVGLTEPLKITVTYYTDKPKKGTIPNSVEILDYEAVSPFIEGETIMMEEMSFPIAADGTVSFNLNIPDDAATGTIMAEFRDKRVYKEISRFRSPSEVFMKAETGTNSPLKVGETAMFKVTSSEIPAQGEYLIVSKNRIVASGKFDINGPNAETSIPFRVSRDMAPSARFLAYFIRDDDEIVADGLNFVVDDIYENKVTIEFDQTDNVKPKTDVNLRVKADAGSAVNVLVVDRSVRLLASGNDITQERVENELSQYGDTPYIARGWGMILPWPVTADDASDVFNNAQLKVLTDANLYRFNLWDLNRAKSGGHHARAFSAGAGVAMDMVESRSMALGGGAASAPEGQIRKEFPETWIWATATADANGFADISAKVPDTITTWEANAYALNAQTGLGVAPVTSNLTAFLPFFVAMQLPYSVIRGETAVIQANVFNYHPEELQVLVTLKGSPNFVGINVDTNGLETEITGDLTRCVLVRPGKPTPVFFSIKPTIVGPLQIIVRIDEKKQRNIFDEVFRSLPVKAEGEEKDMNIPTLISHKKQNDVTTKSIPIVYPPKTVPDSQKIRVTAFGDVFGPSLENLDTLIKMPYGCGEQNMLHFAPAVFAAVYMNLTNRFTDDTVLQEKIQHVLKTGYMRQLVYQRHDNSFSAFGNADPEGSIWLTSFVIKSFAQASRIGLVYIDPRVISGAVKYIAKHQTPSGNFVNTGIVSHKAMQGGSAASERSLTAYVLIALEEVRRANIKLDDDAKRKLDRAIEAATTYLDERIFRPISDYEAAIVSYALELVGSPMYALFLNRLEESKNLTTEDGSWHWTNPSYALQIEIASYALLTYNLKKDTNKGMRVLDWLVRNRNSYGGFSSTQDTVVALQALSEFAESIYSDKVNMDIQLSTTKNGVQSPTETLHLDKQSHDVLLYADFDGDVDSVNVEGRGAGLAVVDVNIFYNIEEEPEPPSYTLTVRPYDESKQKFMIKACTKFLIPNAKSNMAIMSVGVPSGFEPEKEGLESHSLVKRVEMAGGRLIIYFDEIPTHEVCLDIKVQRVSIVAGVKDANIIVYSYYEPGERVLVNYLPDILKQNSGLCSLCGAECGCGPNTVSLSMDQCVPSSAPPQ